MNNQNQLPIFVKVLLVLITAILLIWAVVNFLRFIVANFFWILLIVYVIGFLLSYFNKKPIWEALFWPILLIGSQSYRDELAPKETPKKK